jgi:hypothetical protein
VIQNHSSRSFSVTAAFTSQSTPGCASVSPWTLVGSLESAMLSAERLECLVDTATVTVKDEFGFFVETFDVVRQESLP